jgi:hypothetical protein
MILTRSQIGDIRQRVAGATDQRPRDVAALLAELDRLRNAAHGRPNAAPTIPDAEGQAIRARLAGAKAAFATGNLVDHAKPGTEDGRRLFLDGLLDILPGPYAMLFAFIDETGTHQRSPGLCVAGVLYDRKGLRRLDQAWRRELGAAGIRCFHAVDCAHLRGEFEGKDRAFADGVYRKLIETFKKHTCGSVTVCSITRGEFDVFRGELGYSPYTICSYACMSLLVSLARRLEHESVSFFIESGHPHMGELDALIRRQRRAGWAGVESYSFSDKDGIRALQTADIMAYEVGKRLRDMTSTPDKPSERRLRKSLGALISKDRNHQVAVVTRALLSKFYRSLRPAK